MFLDISWAVWCLIVRSVLIAWAVMLVIVALLAVL